MNGKPNQPSAPSSKEEKGKKEKLEFLKRAEIRTMQKDIARLREEEARKERERIIKLKEEKELKKERKLAEKIREKARKKAEKEIPPSPKPGAKPPSRFEKIFIRIVLAVLIILFLVLVFALVYDWEKLLPEKEPVTKEKTEERIEGPVKEEEKIPPAVIPFEKIHLVEISSEEELPQTISTLLDKRLGEDEFMRVVIKNTSKDEFLTLPEFLEAFEVETPESFYSKLTGNFDLYLYATKNFNRLGFIAEIKEKEGLLELLNSWQDTMEEDFEKLSEVEGKEFPARESAFKEKNYKGNIFYYITFTPLPDYFGVCYGMADNYLIFTSSCHNTLDLLDLITRKYEY